MLTLEAMRERYPFVDQLLQGRYLPFRSATVDQLYLNVVEAGPELMWREPDDIGMREGENRWVSQGEPPHYLGQKADYLFMVLADGSLDPESYVDWARVRGRGFKRVLEVVSNYPQPISAVAWMSVYAWYERDAQGRPGAYRAREVELTVYEAPPQGWRQLALTADVADAYLTTQMMVRGIVRRDAMWLEADRRLRNVVKQFETGIYRNGLRPIIDASRRKGMTGEFDGIALRSFVALGRVMVALEDATCSVTFLGAEEGKPALGVHGVGGTLRQIEAMVPRLVRAWGALSPKQHKAMYRDNDNISPW